MMPTKISLGAQFVAGRPDGMICPSVSMHSSTPLHREKGYISSIRTSSLLAYAGRLSLQQKDSPINMLLGGDSGRMWVLAN